MNKLLTTLLAGAFVCVSVPALAAMDKAAYKAEKDRIAAEYKTDKSACKPMKANAKDVCMKEAKAKEKIAKADAEAAYKGTDKAKTHAQKVRAEEAYDVAKEKCDDQTGKAKSQCKKDAKATMTQAKAAAK